MMNLRLMDEGKERNLGLACLHPEVNEKKLTQIRVEDCCWRSSWEEEPSHKMAKGCSLPIHTWPYFLYNILMFVLAGTTWLTSYFNFHAIVNWLWSRWRTSTTTPWPWSSSSSPAGSVGSSSGCSACPALRLVYVCTTTSSGSTGPGTCRSGTGPG